MKQKVRARLYWPLVILIIVSIAGVIAISFFSCRFAIALAKQSNGIATVDTLLSAGIGITGIMIAVWTGLSISNVVSRKDVDKLNVDIEAARKNMCAIDAYIAEDVHIQAELFYVETSRNNWDPLLRYIIFSFPPVNEIGEVTNLFSDLTIVELKYTQVKSHHQSKYKYDQNLITLADEGIKKIETIKKGRRIPHRIVNTYLNYRMCGFNFFAGYCEKTKLLGVERFVKAAQEYRKLSSALNVSLKKDTWPDKPDAVERKCHLANSIGESYSKIVQYYCDEHMNEDMRLQFGTKIRQYAKDAIKFCETAVDAEKELDYHTLSVFSRNLGAAYERVDKLNIMLGQIPKYQKEIIDSYNHSITYAELDDAPNLSTIRSAYLAFLSFLGRYLFETRENTDLDLLQEQNVRVESAFNYFPSSIEIKLLYELTKRLYMRINPNSVSPEQIDIINTIKCLRKKLSDSITENDRISRIHNEIEVLIEEEDTICRETIPVNQ